jgi:glycosyltransferase involved in cell wall biosynthesis
MTNHSAPQVSVIIPAYNTAELISACLNSVFQQTYTDFEAIVVNDGSPDTPELERALEPYLTRIVYIKQQNKKAAGARNTAIRKARGQFLAFLDSDDSWLPEHLDLQMKLFRENPSLDLVYSDVLVVWDPTQVRRFTDRCPSQGEATFSALIAERCQVPVSTVVVRRDAIMKAGLFDETLSCFDDYDMWVRTAYCGGKIGYSRDIQARASGRRPGSLSQSVAKMRDGYCTILEKLLRTLPLNPAERELVASRLVQSRAMYQLEEAKCELQHRQFGKAKELFRQANRYLRRPSVKLAVVGLDIAPSATSKLIETWNLLRSRRSNH